MPLTIEQKDTLAKHLVRNTMGASDQRIMRALIAEHGGDITDMFNDLRPLLAKIFKEDVTRDGIISQAMAEHKIKYPGDNELDKGIDHLIDKLVDKVIVDVRTALEAIPAATPVAVDNGFMPSFSFYKLKAAYPNSINAAGVALVAVVGALALYNRPGVRA